MINYKKINARICDRTNSWCWQTDRNISQEEVKEIWTDRHQGIINAKLIEMVNKELKGNKLVSIDEVDKNAQENLGCINSVRVGTLDNGKKVIIRCHPKGIKNGYFYVESLVAQKLKDMGLPAYSTFCIHDNLDQNDCAFQVIEKLEGIAVNIWIDNHPEDEKKLTYEAGKMMRKINSFKVSGFGSFDNEKAKAGELVCYHKSLAEFVNCGLKSNLSMLVKFKCISQNQKKKILKLFLVNDPLFNCKQSVLIHNDFVDWNLLTDGKTITGILDLDECAGGSPECDIAAWSGMSSLDRLQEFLRGYWGNEKPSEEFYKKLDLISFRWIISKMALRNSRIKYMPDDKIQRRLLADGQKQLQFYLKKFNLAE